MKKKSNKIKMIIGIILTFNLFSINAFSDEILKLNSGEEMKGKLNKLEKGILYFNFKGNELKIKIDQIESIYFNSSNINRKIIDNNKTTLKGVVTYFFNENYGYKPDIGSEIFLIRKSELKDFDEKSVNDFRDVYFYRNLYKSYLDLDTGMDELVLKSYNEYGIKTEEQWEKYDKKVFNECRKIINHEKVLKLTVDGNGVFNTTLITDEYYILAFSKNRTSLSLTDISGKMYFSSIKLENGIEKNINIEFKVL